MAGGDEQRLGTRGGGQGGVTRAGGGRAAGGDAGAEFRKLSRILAKFRKIWQFWRGGNFGEVSEIMLFVIIEF